LHRLRSMACEAPFTKVKQVPGRFPEPSVKHRAREKAMSVENVLGCEASIDFFGPDIGDVVNSGGQEVVVGPGYGYTYGHSNAYGTTYGTVVNSGGQAPVQVAA